MHVPPSSQFKGMKSFSHPVNHHLQSSNLREIYLLKYTNGQQQLQKQHHLQHASSNQEILCTNNTEKLGSVLCDHRRIFLATHQFKWKFSMHVEPDAKNKLVKFNAAHLKKRNTIKSWENSYNIYDQMEYERISLSFSTHFLSIKQISESHAKADWFQGLLKDLPQDIFLTSLEASYRSNIVIPAKSIYSKNTLKLVQIRNELAVYRKIKMGNEIGVHRWTSVFNNNISTSNLVLSLIGFQTDEQSWPLIEQVHAPDQLQRDVPTWNKPVLSSLCSHDQHVYQNFDINKNILFRKTISTRVDLETLLPLDESGANSKLLAENLRSLAELKKPALEKDDTNSDFAGLEIDLSALFYDCASFSPKPCLQISTLLPRFDFRSIVLDFQKACLFKPVTTEIIFKFALFRKYYFNSTPPFVHKENKLGCCPFFSSKIVEQANGFYKMHNLADFLGKSVHMGDHTFDMKSMAPKTFRFPQIDASVFVVHADAMETSFLNLPKLKEQSRILQMNRNIDPKNKPLEKKSMKNSIKNMFSYVRLQQSNMDSVQISPRKPLAPAKPQSFSLSFKKLSKAEIKRKLNEIDKNRMVATSQSMERPARNDLVATEQVPEKKQKVMPISISVPRGLLCSRDTVEVCRELVGKKIFVILPKPANYLTTIAILAFSHLQTYSNSRVFIALAQVDSYDVSLLEYFLRIKLNQSKVTRLGKDQSHYQAYLAHIIICEAEYLAIVPSDSLNVSFFLMIHGNERRAFYQTEQATISRATQRISRDSITTLCLLHKFPSYIRNVERQKQMILSNLSYYRKYRLVEDRIATPSQKRSDHIILMDLQRPHVIYVPYRSFELNVAEVISRKVSELKQLLQRHGYNCYPITKHEVKKLINEKKSISGRDKDSYENALSEELKILLTIHVCMQTEEFCKTEGVFVAENFLSQARVHYGDRIFELADVGCALETYKVDASSIHPKSSYLESILMEEQRKMEIESASARLARRAKEFRALLLTGSQSSLKELLQSFPAAKELVAESNIQEIKHEDSVLFAAWIENIRGVQLAFFSHILELDTEKEDISEHALSIHVHIIELINANSLRHIYIEGHDQSELLNETIHHDYILSDNVCAIIPEDREKYVQEMSLEELVAKL